MLVDQPLGLVNFRFGDEGFQSLEIMLEFQSTATLYTANPRSKERIPGGYCLLVWRV